MDDNSIKSTCCEELSEECKNVKNTQYGKWEKRAKVLNDVTYLDNWGKSILKAKNNAFTYYVTGCKIENKKYKTQQECDAKNANCCFNCESADCGPKMPAVSTCKDGKPSDFMKKHGGGEKCSTDGSVNFGMTSEWYVCTLGLTLVGHFSKES